MSRRAQTFHRFPALALGIYALCTLTAIIYAGVKDLHTVDLGLTVSVYVGLYPWTSILFGVGLSVITVLLSLYLRKTDAKLFQKLLYAVILLCILGCGWFPCNSARNSWAADIHNGFAKILIPSIMLSFVLMAVFARNIAQKRFSLRSSLFSAFCLVCMIWELSFFDNTVLIWENWLILLFLREVSLEGASAEA